MENRTKIPHKELLLKDLCARLPYGIKVQVYEWAALDTELKIAHIKRLQNDEIELKPYLCPLTSMTEKEKTEFFQLMGNGTDIQRIDFYLSHYFDFRCLIPMGLALEAKEGMYKID